MLKRRKGCGFQSCEYYNKMYSLNALWAILNESAIPNASLISVLLLYTIKTNIVPCTLRKQNLDLKTSLSYASWQRLERLRRNGTKPLYCYIYPWFNGILELFKMQTMKESPLLHIAKYHIQQHLQVSQHYSSAEIKCPQVPHIKRKV